MRSGWRTYKLSFVGTRGAPDRLFGKDGRSILIEFKAPGEKPTPQQTLRHTELREQFGFDVRWTDSLDGARDILDLPEFWT
jgi:hypothetical protein